MNVLAMLWIANILGWVNQGNVSYKKIVGRQIKLLRLSNGLTQDALAQRCGIFRTYLSRIESGSANPTLLILEALADALNVHPFELFGEPQPVKVEVLS